MRIGVVPYINALPLCRYLPYPLVYAPPASLESQMADGNLDIALLPSFAYLNNPTYEGYFDAGVIQSEGAVESVLLFYRENLQNPREIKSIKYSEESITSIALFKVIYNKLWQKNLDKLKTDQPVTDAILKIGDSALFFDKTGYKVCDLGEIWSETTGLPFIYALWVSRKKLDPDVMEALKKAKTEGLRKLEEIIAGCPDLPPDRMRRYLTESIQYEYSRASFQGLKKFQEYCLEMGLLKEKRML